jgi:hypothetical protein
MKIIDYLTSLSRLKNLDHKFQFVGSVFIQPQIGFSAIGPDASL